MPADREKIFAIQFLRGIGAIMVVLCHTSFTSWGSSGVEFFLIISGFVAMYSTKYDVQNYWIKRIIKIVPLYWLVTLSTGFFVYVVPQLFNSYEVSAEYLIKSLLFIPYEHSGIVQPLLGVGWTLNYEMFFYLLFWIAIKINHQKRGEYVIASSIFLVVLNWVLELPLPFSFWMDEILLEFSYGIILFCLYEKHKNKAVIKNKNVANVVCCLAVTVGAVCMEKTFAMDIPRGIGVGLIGMVVVAVVLFFGENLTFPKMIIFIGNISYVLYLTHIYPVRLVETIINCPEDFKLLLAILSILIAIGCAALWDALVEQKVQITLRKAFIYKT